MKEERESAQKNNLKEELKYVCCNPPVIFVILNIDKLFSVRSKTCLFENKEKQSEIEYCGIMYLCQKKKFFLSLKQ